MVFIAPSKSICANVAISSLKYDSFNSSRTYPVALLITTTKTYILRIALISTVFLLKLRKSISQHCRFAWTNRYIALEMAMGLHKLY